jgi:undecaprenyl-phosphate galactose phosphotransferase
MPMKTSGLRILILGLLDWACVVTSLIAAIVLRGREFHGELALISLPYFDIPIYVEYVFLAGYGGVVTIAFNYFSLYRVDVFTSVLNHIVRIVKGLIFAVVGLALLAFFIRSAVILDSRLSMFYFPMICFSLLVGARVVVFRTIYVMVNRRQMFRRRAIIVGTGEAARDVAINVSMNSQLGVDVVGYLDDELPIGHPVFSGAKVVGRLTDVKDSVEAVGVDELIVCVEGLEQSRFLGLLNSCLDTPAAVKVSSPLYAVIPEHLDIEKYGNVGVVTISQVGPGPVYETYKRVFDVALAAIGALLLAPVFAAIAFSIKVESAGPIVYTQTRVGRNGRGFKFYKFRSMYVGSDTDPDREINYAKLISGEWSGGDAKAPAKIVDSAKVTRVGTFLRKTSLDELPQLLNVIRGNMSLVGPRPCLPYEWNHYQEWHKQRASVTPGCTGLWQVFGRSLVGFQDMVIFDLFYSQNASLGLDVWLLLKTIPVMVTGRGGK